MVPIADASAAHLLPALAQVVEPGTIVQADSWKAYSGLKKLGYSHEVIRQTIELGENLLPKISITAALLKRWLLGTHQGAVPRSFGLIARRVHIPLQQANNQVTRLAFLSAVAAKCGSRTSEGEGFDRR
jgi:hypothetical protein